MIWENFVTGTVGWLTCFGMLATVRGSGKPALSTSVQNSVYVAAVAVSMASLGLWLGAASNFLLAGLWGWIAAQSIAARKRQRERAVPAVPGPP